MYDSLIDFNVMCLMPQILFTFDVTGQRRQVRSLCCNVRASWAHKHLLLTRKQGHSEALNILHPSGQLHSYQLGRADEH